MGLAGAAHLGLLQLSRRASLINAAAPCWSLALASSFGYQRNFPRGTFFTSQKSKAAVSYWLVPKDRNQQLKQHSTVAAMSAAQSQTSTPVEHVIFFKVKEDPKSEELFEELRALKSLDVINELSAGKVLQILGADYTHVLHSRHPNKAALEAYAVHPSHQAVVKKLADVIEDRLAVDWEAEPVGLPIKGGHGAARIALIKFSEGVTEEEKEEVFALLNGLRDKFPFIRQISVGANFSPARAKGFGMGFVALFDNLDELEQLNGNAELHGELRRSRVSPFLQSFVIADIETESHLKDLSVSS